MTYSMSGSLQVAVFNALADDPAVQSLVGQDIYDALPSGTVPETYVSLGRERVQDASDLSAAGAVHRFDISVITTQPGFNGAKAIAAAVSDRLHNSDLTLSRGRLVYLRFERAEARRIDANAGREIVLRFRARVDDDQ